SVIHEYLFESGDADTRTAMQKWQENIDAAERFIISCQYQKSQKGNWSHPIDVSGAFRQGFNIASRDNSKVQINYCQHAISALLGWYKRK
ncbi:MAG: hypothetical protein MJH11_09005, partial [Lentisphaeria bacterium]|nr:hypothetical protein [Lentisphaeria bacterium]